MIVGKNVGAVIRDHERDNLHIGWDGEPGFVLLFTPDMSDINVHYHVELDLDQASKLSEFLNKKLEEIGRKPATYDPGVAKE